MENITLGILGDGQLGRMSALAAANLGIKTHIFGPNENGPGAQVATQFFKGDYEDREKLDKFCASVDFITYEFENIPLETLQYLSLSKPVFPKPAILEIAQHRVKEKQFLNDCGIKTAQWRAIKSKEDIKNFSAEIEKTEFILKTCRFGYDGKGQVLSSINNDLETEIESLNSNEIIFEEKIDFIDEISVIIGRDARGNIETYGPCLNNHKNHILSETIVPAPLDPKVTQDALETAHALASSLDLRGVLALEMFVTADGEVLANEIAPRPHNSGHWTIDACAVSQFENHVRTVCGLPIGKTTAHSSAKMLNLLGEDARDLKTYYEMENACIHLYGKQEIREGRKMGHVTILNAKTKDQT